MGRPALARPPWHRNSPIPCSCRSRKERRPISRLPRSAIALVAEGIERLAVVGLADAVDVVLHAPVRALATNICGGWSEFDGIEISTICRVGQMVQLHGPKERAATASFQAVSMG